MKMKQRDFQKIKGHMTTLANKHGGFEAIKRDYKQRGLSIVRCAWDIFRATGLKIEDINLHSYLEDSHITTALKKIIGPYR